jgi:HAE1 family hydrophobic/amphiphilic exporter-1
MGTLPIALGAGAGAESRRPLGLAVVGGLMFSQLVTLYATPVFYVYLDRLQNLLTRGRSGVEPPTPAAESKASVNGRHAHQPAASVAE